MMAVKINKYKTGWRWLLIKAICAIIIVFLAELLLGTLTNKDPLGKALAPFHNHYFSFSGHYLTTQGLGSGFSDDPSATIRFVIYFILGYLIFAVINIAIWLMPVLRQKASHINPVLFYMLLAGAFMLAFFFPPRITVIDTDGKEVIVTRHSYLFIPTTVHIPFSSIGKIEYNIATDYDGYNKQYINYMVISLTTKGGIKIPLGEIQAGEQKGTLVHKPVAVVTAEKKGLAEEAVSGVEAAVR
jgi:hypothetical protein